MNLPLRSFIHTRPLLHCLTYLSSSLAPPGAQTSLFGVVTLPVQYFPYALLGVYTPLPLSSCTWISLSCYRYGPLDGWSIHCGKLPYRHRGRPPLVVHHVWCRWSRVTWTRTMGASTWLGQDVRRGWASHAGWRAERYWCPCCTAKESGWGAGRWGRGWRV